MRWKVKKLPEHGDTDRTLHFAWLPVRIGDEMVWLQDYVIHWRYEFSAAAVISGLYGWRKVSREHAP